MGHSSPAFAGDALEELLIRALVLVLQLIGKWPPLCFPVFPAGGGGNNSFYLTGL